MRVRKGCLDRCPFPPPPLPTCASTWSAPGPNNTSTAPTRARHLASITAGFCVAQRLCSACLPPASANERFTSALNAVHTFSTTSLVSFISSPPLPSPLPPLEDEEDNAAHDNDAASTTAHASVSSVAGVTSLRECRSTEDARDSFPGPCPVGDGEDFALPVVVERDDASLFFVDGDGDPRLGEDGGLMNGSGVVAPWVLQHPPIAWGRGEGVKRTRQTSVRSSCGARK